MTVKTLTIGAKTKYLSEALIRLAVNKEVIGSGDNLKLIRLLETDTARLPSGLDYYFSVSKDAQPEVEATTKVDMLTFDEAKTLLQKVAEPYTTFNDEQFTQAVAYYHANALYGWHIKRGRAVRLYTDLDLLRTEESVDKLEEFGEIAQKHGLAIFLNINRRGEFKVTGWAHPFLKTTQLPTEVIEIIASLL